MGSPGGNRGGGKSSLEHGFLFLRENRLKKNKVLFLFDPDVEHLPKVDKDINNLYVERMDEYSPSKKGIESLFPEHILEEGYLKGYVSKILRRYEPTLTYELEDRKRKRGFCNWICKKRDNRLEDFEGFQKIVRIIEAILG